MASNGIKEKLEEIEIDNDDDIIIDFNDEDE